MKIALMIDSLEGGGAEHVVRQLAVGLTCRGDCAYVYCLKAAGRDLTELKAAGVKVREARSRGKDPGLIRRLIGWMRRDGVHLVHAHSSAAYCWALPPTKWLNLPLAVTRHGAHLGKRNFYPRWADRLLPLADRVVIVAEALRGDACRRNAVREAVLISNGVDHERLDRAEARRALENLCEKTFDGPIILSVGTVCPEKDQITLLNAFARLRPERANANLIIVGGKRNQAYNEKARSVAAKLALNERIHFTGQVADAWRLMAGADVFCQSSRTEAAPIAIIEAMSQATPIVATAVGGVGRLDGSDKNALLNDDATALLVEPASPRTLAAALRRSLDDPPAARLRGERAAVEYARRFASEPMVRNYQRVYAQCLAEPKRERRNEQASRKYGSRTRRPSRPSIPAAPGVVMLGPAPPLIGGMVTSIGLLMKCSLSATFRLHRVGTTFAPKHAVETGLFRRAAGALGRRATSIARLARLLRRERINILHIHTCSYATFYLNLLDMAAAKMLGCKTVLHIRGGKFERFCRDSGRLGGWIIRRGLEAADAVIVLSNGWRDALKPYAGKARLTVVPNAFDPDIIPTQHEIDDARLERYADDPDPPCRFLFMTLVREAKGVGDLIEAAGMLRDAGTPFELHIAGPATDGDEDRWRRQVREAGLEHVITFLGSVSGRDKARTLAGADVCVHPSRVEGLPNSVLEGGAAGLPVIAAKVGAVPEIYYPSDLEAAGESLPIGPIVPPRDPSALAREMQRLALDEDLRQKIGRRMRDRFIAEYGVDRLADRIGSIYRDLLKAQRPRATEALAKYDARKRVVTAAPRRLHQMSAAPTASKTPREKANALTWSAY